VAIIGVLVAPWMLEVLRTPANILAPAAAYAKIVFLASPVFFPYLAYTTILRGTGDSQTPFYFLIVSTVLSLILTPAFILGWAGLPKLGVVSAAVGSLLSQGLAFVGLLVALARMNHPLKFDKETARDMLVDWKILWSILKIGVPTGLQVVMLSLAEIAIITFVNRFGSNATAAYGAVNQVVSYVQFPALAIGMSAGIFGAQCIGARREDMLGKVVRTAVGMNYIVGGVIIALCYIFAWPILGWFIVDPHTLTIAHTLLMVTLWSYVLFGNSAVIAGVVRSSGAVLVPTINGILGIWLVEVPVAYVLMQHFGLNGVWMGYPAYFIVVVLLQYFYYTAFWKKQTHERLV
jgi:putative MATE family efflux protein